MRKIKTILGIGLFLFLSASVLLADKQETDYDITLNGIQLSNAVTSDIHLRVFVNENVPSSSPDKKIFAIAGWTSTANTWGPLAEELFQYKQDVTQIIAIDLPGQGESTVSPSQKFGELSLNDYVTAIAAALKESKVHNLIGHSQGGLLIKMLQDRLIKNGSSLKNEFGIDKVVLLAPAPSQEEGWKFLDPSNPAGFQLTKFLPFLIDNASHPYESPLLEKYGFHIRFFPDAYWVAFSFLNLRTGLPSSIAPSPAEVANNKYNAPAPLQAALELVGYRRDPSSVPPFTLASFTSDPSIRPSVNSGIFEKKQGSDLKVIVYQYDASVRPEEGTSTYKYLTGETGGPSEVVVIGGDEAVHGLHISQPKSVASTLNELKFP